MKYSSLPSPVIGREYQRVSGLGGKRPPSLCATKDPIKLLVLDAVMIALWWTWRDGKPDVGDLFLTFFQALPLALLAVYLLPMLTFVGGGAVWEAVKALVRRVKS